MFSPSYSLKNIKFALCALVDDVRLGRATKKRPARCGPPGPRKCPPGAPKYQKCGTGKNPQGGPIRVAKILFLRCGRAAPCETIQKVGNPVPGRFRCEARLSSTRMYRPPLWVDVCMAILSTPVRGSVVPRGSEQGFRTHFSPFPLDQGLTPHFLKRCGSAWGSKCPLQYRRGPLTASGWRSFAGADVCTPRRGLG